MAIEEGFACQALGDDLGWPGGGVLGLLVLVAAEEIGVTGVVVVRLWRTQRGGQGWARCGVQGTEEELLLISTALGDVEVDLELIEVVSVVAFVGGAFGLDPGGRVLSSRVRLEVAFIVEAGLVQGRDLLLVVADHL